MASIGKSNSGSAKEPSKIFSGNKTWFVAAIIAAVCGAAVVFTIVASMLQTTTYYVLNSDVPAKSQITAEMLEEVSTQTGTEPRNALGLDAVVLGDVYAKYTLNRGDILTASNTGEQVPLLDEVPANFTAASLYVEPNNAVGGKITTGNYIDIYATDEEAGTSKAVLRNVLVLDVTASASEYEEAEDVTTEAETDAQDTLRAAGMPFLYTLAVSDQDAAVLATIRTDSLYLTIAPRESQENFKDKDISANRAEILGAGSVGNSGKGTENVGKDVEKSVEDNAAPSEAPAE